MFKATLLAATLIGAVALPAVAQAQDYQGRDYQGQDYRQAQDYRFEGGGRGGYGDNRGGNDGQRWDGGRPARAYPLDPRQISQRLRYQGYRHVDVINQRRDVTIVRAEARGRDFILVVDAYSGDILRRRAADDGWRGGNGWHGGWGQDWRRW